ncbi:transglycosylase SLT domain-containing protein [Marinitoga aeolica]|uniref:Transporter substrate-binding domain-containing protein n=1 Tax=Marinitoga aeolica TaxID=2809031 RepID=A0ABY8PN02_9BACT|nr:transporter substrate-binding domain-containing protein [Marinitoga aeolica]WGS64022.1 transporter substrate-binding domain-containing protein [Marinitoga aeolica]
MYKKIIFLIVFFTFIFSVINARTLKEILDSGYLIIGIRNIPSDVVYQPDIPNKPGFCYELAKSFADYLNVDMKIKIVNYFSDYWTKNGKNMLKNNLSGIPDIYNSIDIVADIITVTDQRKKLVKMIPFIENAELFFTRKSENISSYNDFKGKKIITAETYNFYTTLINELNKRKLHYIINKISIDNDKIIFLEPYKKPSKNDVEILLIPEGIKFNRYAFYYQVILKNADISILDSFSFFSKIFNTYTFKENLKPLFIANNIGYLAFCTSPKTLELNAVLGNFMSLFKETEKFNLLFKKYIGINYYDYLDILKRTR